MNRARVLAVLTLLAVFAGASAAEGGASRPTTTTGRICCYAPHPKGVLEDFGGYVFSGKTRPSHHGAHVVFSYKPKGGAWHKFGVGPSSSRPFYVLEGTKPTARINGRHHWSAYFSTGARTARWRIRAVFPSQNGFRRSTVRKTIRTLASD